MKFHAKETDDWFIYFKYLLLNDCVIISQVKIFQLIWWLIRVNLCVFEVVVLLLKLV